MEVPINYLAVLVAGVMNMAIGFFWYGPIFGKYWVSLMGFTEEQMNAAKAKGMARGYVLTLAGSLVMAYVLAHAIVFAGNYFSGFSALQVGLTAGFWNWLGFIVPVTLGSVIWEGKPYKLWFLNIAYHLVALLVMGVILASWK